MSDAYAALLARLLPARRSGIVFGLERVRALLDRLGAPDRRLGVVVHVGGTNGKGSTVAMIAALATAAGARVATYTSPHLACLRERVVIAGELVGEGAFVAAADEVRAVGGDELTFFEQITAIGIVAIAAAAPDVTVLEVGLGGRLDATTAVASRPIAVVTGVAMDHEAMLGGTLALIAAEKAGIFAAGQRVVIGASGEPAAVATLVAAAHAARVATVTVIDDAAIAAVPAVALPGAHQRRNAAAALAAIDALGALGALDGIIVSPAARAAALATVRHAGRFEVIAGAPRVILDGAHNPHGAAALAAALRDRGDRPVLVLAVSADKDVAGIVRALAADVAAVIATRYQQDRALAPDALAAIVRAIPDAPAVHTAPDLAAALVAATSLAGPRGAIIVAGSLFLVGEARVQLLGAVADPIWVSDPSPTR